MRQRAVRRHAHSRSLGLSLFLLVLLAVIPALAILLYTAIDRRRLLAAETNLAAVGLLAILGVAAAWLCARFLIVRRVKALQAAAERLRAGELEARAEVPGGDEIAAIAHAINDMAEHVQVMAKADRQSKEGLAELIDEVVADRTREMGLLSETGDLLQMCSTSSEAYDVIGRSVAQLFPADAGALFMINESRNVLETKALWGAIEGEEGGEWSPDECWALRLGRPYVVDAARSGTLCLHLPRPSPIAYLCIPLVAQSKAVGVLYVGSLSGDSLRSFGLLEKQRLAEAVARQVSLGLANVSLKESLRNQAIRDPLTGLFNRRYLGDVLAREFSRAARARYSIGLIMLDLDHFKRLNDTFGHDTGDAVLTEVAGLLQAGVRREDVACRLGGEEFVVALPTASLDNTRRRAEAIAAAIRNLQLSRGDQPVGPITVSIGIAVFPEHGTTPEDLLKAADTALYRAKEEGRDRIVLAPGGET